MSRMFSFVGSTWNPAGGACPHKCVYCWSRRLQRRFRLEKYQGEFRLVKKELKRRFKPGELVFVQDMSDLWAWEVPDSIIQAVLDHIRRFPKTKFLLLTKNPERYIRFISNIPVNCVLGATVETNGWTEERGDFYAQISEAPHPEDRIKALLRIKELETLHQTMISVEPILEFDFNTFLSDLAVVQPDFIVIGYDNYNCRLPEPPLEKTKQLIAALEEMGFQVYCKTLRKAWQEAKTD